MAFLSSGYKDVQGHVQDIFARNFHSKLQKGDEETRFIFLCRGKFDNIKQKERNRLVAQCRYANGEEYRMNKLPRVLSTAKNI